MPQTTRRGVAPLNPQPRWPGWYIAVLREAGAQEKTIHALCGVGTSVLRKASGPQAPGPGPDRNRGIPG